MASWQRPARLALGVFAVAFAVVLWLVVGERQPPAAVAPIERIDKEAVSETRGGDVVQLKGSKNDVTVRFATQVSYADGRTRLTGFQANIEDRGGRSFVVTGQEAWVGAEKSSYDLRGEVTMNTSDGLTVVTPAATFTEAEGILRGAGPVKFQRARVSGSGVGFTYDRGLDRLWLQDQAVITVAPDTDGKGGMQVQAGSAGHSRAERYMRLERGATITREGQVIRADESTIFLLKDRDEPENVELRGHSRIDGSTGLGSLRTLEARDINLHYMSDGRTLEQALLAGQSGIQLARPDGSPGQQLTAEYVDVGLSTDGTVSRLVAREKVNVVLPATADSPARTVTSAELNGTGEPGKGLTAMTFENGVEYREAAAGDRPERVVRGRTLKTRMSDAGTISHAAFSTGFRFEQGALVATSVDGEYDVVQGTLALKSPDGGARPRVSDERVTIDARQIDVTLDPRRMAAEGNVAMTLNAGRRREGDRGTTLLSDREAAFVNADELVLDEQTGTGTYTGQARLWQQETGTSIKAETITMNEKGGTMTASGKVITALPVAGKTEGGKAATSLAQAGEFQFDDAKRRAVFGKQAQFDGSQGNLRAEHIELTLASADNALEKLTAKGSVKIIVDKRQAEGTQLTYDPKAEMYVLNGSPVKLVEGCQESTGRTLTFYKTSDRVSVDGNEEIRTQTRGGGARCPGTPR